MIILSQKKSLTLIELIAFMVIIGIAAGSMLTLLSEVTRKAKFSQDLMTASFSAEQLTEEAIAKGFTNVTNYSITSANASDGFAKSVIVRFCNITGTQWWVSDDPSSAYKLVNVTVSKPITAVTVTMNTVLSSY